MRLLKIKKIFFPFLFISSILAAQEINPINQDTLSLVAVGDIMLGTDFPRNLLPPNDGNELMKNVSSVLKSGDLTFGNMEGVLLNGGEPEKKCKDSTICYIFRTPEKYVNNFTEAGFDILSLSNNHSNDFGDTGRAVTRQTLTNAGIKYAGIVDETAFFEIRNIRIAFIAFSVSEDCYSILEIPKAQKEIEKLNRISDVVIVSFHGGAEGEDAKHVTGEDEMMYEEERGNVKEFAHAVIDAGADIVIGHGPHVPRALELYNHRLIAYSLGNFCTYRGFSIVDSKGLAPILKVNFNREGEFINGEIISARQIRSRGTVLDKYNRAAKLISQLTNEDFPDSKLIITNQGLIERKIIN